MEIKLHQKEKQKNRLEQTADNIMLVFSLVNTLVEDVEKECDVMKLFIETGQVSAKKDLHIPITSCYQRMGVENEYYVRKD